MILFPFYSFSFFFLFFFPVGWCFLHSVFNLLLITNQGNAIKHRFLHWNSRATNNKWWKFAHVIRRFLIIPSIYLYFAFFCNFCSEKRIWKRISIQAECKQLQLMARAISYCYNIPFFMIPFNSIWFRSVLCCLGLNVYKSNQRT